LYEVTVFARAFDDGSDFIDYLNKYPYSKAEEDYYYNLVFLTK